MTRFNGVAGIFIGGSGSRLGGIPKGLLPSPCVELTLVEDIARKLDIAGVDHTVLVGEHRAYDNVQMPKIQDAADGQGPVAGLLALARYAIDLNRRFVLAVACDMPYLSIALLRLLCTHDLEAIALVPKRELREPLCARYQARAVEDQLVRNFREGKLSLMSLLNELGTQCTDFAPDAEMSNALTDWDEPDDLPASIRRSLGSTLK